MKRLVMAIAILAAGTAFTASAQTAAPDPAKVAAGKKVYDAASSKCSMCHAIAGKGNAKYPLDGIGGKMTAADLKMWFTDPAAMEAKLKTMPAVKMSSMVGKSVKLSPADVDNLVAYMLSLK